MRVLIVGAGAVGQFLATRLAQGGHDVVVLARPVQADAINAGGITLHVQAQELVVAVKAAGGIDDPLLLTPFEVVVIAVKSYSTAEVATSLTDIPACNAASILTVQNGVGNEDILAERFGADRVVAGALTVSVERTASTSVVATAEGGLCIAPLGSSPHNWLIAALAMDGLPVRAVSDWRALKWSKLCINILGNAVCAVLDWLPAQVYN
ncbi:MAG: ketopantoate reductase family protein, partial [Candidatus Eremiobacteraeota bacterium]|nr:ketopantoate reductase family protein [Candidatus Eremiobacteraeota bacterium]